MSVDAETVEGQLPREEYVDNVPTGVEAEEVSEGQEEISHPWEPEQIRVNTKSFSLRHILDMIDEDDIELAPDFQRNQVWKLPQKSRLIESILLQIPLPAFYFAEDSDGLMRVVDGLQRLSSVRQFVRGGREDGFALKGLEYLDANARRFEDLPAAWRRRINNTQIVVHVIDPTTPTDIKYDIFKRINTGGSPLSSQEIRHCMSKDRSRNFLKRCTETTVFDQATGGRLRGHPRMNDREMALRFCAFQILGLAEYREQYQAMDPFLDAATAALDGKNVDDAALEEVYNKFMQSMRNCWEVFGLHAFRKWPNSSDTRLSPINRPLFDSWSVALVDYDLADLRARRDDIVGRTRNLMTEDTRYIESISTSTGDPRKVTYRFRKAVEAAEAGR